MKNVITKSTKLIIATTITLAGLDTIVSPAFARDVEYKNTEIPVYVTPGEPTQMLFPGNVSGGVKRRSSTLSLQHTGDELVIFAGEGISENGEAIIVRLNDGRSYSVRVKKAGAEGGRDDVIKIEDSRTAAIMDAAEEPAYREKKFDYAPPSQISGLMREMMLNAEFGKSSIPGYRISQRNKGEVVLNDGTLEAKIDRIYIGPNLWGYVLETTNMIDQHQKINPASFRLDGTRAISMSRWELAARPLNMEQQVAGAHTTKVYVITRARNGEK